MNRSPLSFRNRLLVLAIVAIAWLTTRDSPGEVDTASASSAKASSQVVVAGKTGLDEAGR